MSINRTNLAFLSPGQDVAPTQLPPSSGFDGGGASLCGSDAAAAYAFPSDAAADDPSSSSAAPEEFQANISCMPRPLSLREQHILTGILLTEGEMTFGHFLHLHISLPYRVIF